METTNEPMLKRKYGPEIQSKAQELIDAHKANGLDDKQAKEAAIVTVTFMLKTGMYPMSGQTYQKVYNHLTGTPCPFRV